MTKRFAANLIYFTSMLFIVIVRIMSAAGAFSGLSDNGLDMTFSVLVQIVAMGAAPLFLYLLYLGSCNEKQPIRKLLSDFGYTKNISVKGWIIVIVIALLSTYLVTCFSSTWYNILTLMGYKSKISSPVTSYSVGFLFLEIVFTAMLPATFEEFSNRGILYSGYRNSKPYKVILITALMFALMHTNITQLGYTFICGIIAGAFVYYTRSIWPAMLYHFINNFIAVTRDFGEVNGGFFNGLNVMYDWILYSKAGIIVGTFIFVIIALIILILVMKLAADDTERNEKLGVSYADRYETVEVKRWDNLFLYAAIAMNLTVTVFTLVWGIMR